METKHTQGPWHVGKETDYLNQIAIEPAIGCAYGSGEEVKANALAMAASKDMLLALREVLKTPGLQSGVQAMCAAAVAKATGKSIDDVVKGV